MRSLMLASFALLVLAGTALAENPDGAPGLVTIEFGYTGLVGWSDDPSPLTGWVGVRDRSSNGVGLTALVPFASFGTVVGGFSHGKDKAEYDDLSSYRTSNSFVSIGVRFHLGLTERARAALAERVEPPAPR